MILIRLSVLLLFVNAAIFYSFEGLISLNPADMFLLLVLLFFNLSTQVSS